jgi:hypothetical protein
MGMTTGARHRRRAERADGVAGNERLTAMTGAVLLVLFAAEGVTLLRIHQLLTLHFFLGMLLVGPVALKVASTGYRFVRYYAGAGPYVRKGPPAPIMRLLGPVVMATSLAVLGTGVMLALVGPGSSPWIFLHKASFAAWFGAMTIHVLVYAPRLPRLLLGGHGSERSWAQRSGAQRVGAALGGRGLRWLLLAASLACGLLLAAGTLHLTSRWGTGFFG